MTQWFAKAARKARISDGEVCAAIVAVAEGKADDLGGGVFKKRLDKNRSRSIILASDGRFWVYVYLFAKKDLANINDDELDGFKDLAAAYRRETDANIENQVRDGKLLEICNDI
jgi:hypothetical protein